MKTRPIESVVYDWVGELPFQMQALLFTAMRGPDNCTKDNVAKSIVRFLRGAVLKPAANTSMMFNDNSFMWWDYENFCNLVDDFFIGEGHDHYPHHFIMHLIHSAEVLGYCHPNSDTAYYWLLFYREGCKSMHMTPETKQEMFGRLNDFGLVVVARCECGITCENPSNCINEK